MKLSWITLASIALALGAITLAALVPATATVAGGVASFLVGLAIPHGAAQ